MRRNIQIMNTSLQGKRSSSGGGGGPSAKKLRVCTYGENCYRRNPAHFSDFSHPHLDKLLALQTNKNGLSLPEDLDTKQDKTVLLIQLRILKDLNEASCSDQSSSTVTSASGSSSGSGKKQSMTKVVNPGNITSTDSGNVSTSRTNASVNANNSVDKNSSNTNQKPKTSISKSEASTSSPHSSPKQLNKTDTKDTKQDVNTSKQDTKKKTTDSNHVAQQHTAALRELLPPGNPYGDPASKLRIAAPYNFFLTTIKACKPTHSEPLSITFSELIDPVLGDLESSLQINFMVDLGWLLANYLLHGHNKKPLTILFGTDDDPDLNNASKLPPHIKAIRIKTPHPFGHHHTKMSLFQYTDGSLRVIVSTANLIESDWDNRTQGLWISPVCPPLPPGSDTNAGESPTEFKADLLRYLVSYQQPHLQEWIGRVRRADFSNVRVCFVSSVPGSHKGAEFNKWGHRRLSTLLKKHVTAPMDTEGSSKWNIIAQCSSIGALGPDSDSWMCGELRSTMSERLVPNYLQSAPQFKVVYPCFRNVAGSCDGLLGGSCLPYSMKTHQKQTWFTSYLNEWKSEKRHRSEAMPHIKTYTRISPCGKRLAWFVLSSANLSKAAWGSLNKVKGRTCTDPNAGASLHVMSYEAGVLFLPKFLINDTTFPLETSDSSSAPEFTLPYDIPLIPYGPRDKPWVHEYMSL